jgi:hypothetical protein
MINPDITQLGTNSSKYLSEEKEKIEQDFKEVQEKLNSGQQLTLDDTRIVVLRARMIREEAFFIVPENNNEYHQQNNYQERNQKIVSCFVFFFMFLLSVIC